MAHVTVIIPTYNGEKFVADAIGSVLSQSYSNFELLVVDDGSTDDTLEIARSFEDTRVQVHENEANLGIAGNMNRAVALASGDLLAFLDQDDYWSRDKLALHVAAHDEQDAAVVYSDVEVVTTEGHVTERVSPPEPASVGEPLVRQLYVSLNFIRTFSCVSIEHSAWLNAGGLDTDYSVSTDYDLYLRLATTHRFALVDRPLVAKRTHDENASSDSLALYEDTQEILADAREQHEYLTNLTTEERRRYGFQQAFRAYRAEKRDEAFSCCLYCLRNGLHSFGILLLGILFLDRATGRLRLGTQGYQFYKTVKTVAGEDTDVETTPR